MPSLPKAEEVEEHNVTHLPFRSWCPHCVKGKAKGKKHESSKEKSEIAQVSIDYMFMSSSQEGSEEKGMPILVTKDRDSGMVTGPEGGSTGWNCHPLTDVFLIPQIRVPESGHRQDALCGLFFIT